MDRPERQRGAFTEYVIERRLWGASAFFLLDVGCSGGFDQQWQIFGERLRAVGFDPLVAEIERLKASASLDRETYEAAFVTCRDYDRLFPRELRDDRIASRNDDPFPRVSAVAAQSRFDVSYVQQEFNAGAPVVLSDRTVVLDDYVDAPRRPQVDFLKVDTDGHDIEVVLGAQGIMDAGGILGLKVEVQLHGGIHPFANTFANIDRVLREHGFTLFDLTAYRYSRKELPAPFVYDLAAQTTSGQVVWGDAVYFRDLGSPDYGRMWPYEVTPERVVKLACLFDFFDLPDCAAELLVNRGDFLEPAQRTRLLDLLATGEAGSYAARVAAFESDYRAFYPSRLRATMADEPPEVQSVPRGEQREPPDKQVRRLRRRVASLREKNASLRERLKVRGDRIDQLTRRIERLEQKS